MNDLLTKCPKCGHKQFTLREVHYHQAHAEGETLVVDGPVMHSGKDIEGFDEAECQNCGTMVRENEFENVELAANMKGG